MPTITTPPRVLILDPDPASRQRADAVLARAGLAAIVVAPREAWLDQVAEARPDILLLAGGLATADALAALRRNAALADLKVVVWAEGGRPLDRAAAYAAGADEYADKAAADSELERSVGGLDRFELTFWGIRGTLPVPGPTTLRYGGNTSCVSMAVGQGRQFVFDAGTGLRVYSDALMTAAGGHFDGRIFISHPHWDHLNSLPFFRPMYISGNRVHLHGPPQGARSLFDLVSGQMDGVYFPIEVDEFKAEVSYNDLVEGEHRFDGVRIATRRLCHPGHCLAYRVHWQGRTVAYVTDNELGLGADGQPTAELPAGLVEWLRGVDVMIHETTYFDDEYPRRVTWGHSSIGQVTRLAHAAEVGHFYLFHHDPEHGDAEIERKHALAEALLAGWGSRTRCHIAAEGLRVRVHEL